MAIPNNPAIMVLHQDTSTSTLVPKTSACSLFVVVNQLHPAGGRQEKQTPFSNAEASPLEKPTIGSCVANFNKVSSMSLSAMAATNTSNQQCNLPAESTCKGITVTLDNNNMWNEFFRCQTEMILTKQGRRMFPCCRFRISGMEPFQRYTLVMDMQPVDNYRYKWSDRRWETNGKSDPHILRSFVHPDSPATGLDWMQNPVSFYKLKLTNNPLDREGHIVLNSMHRYIPHLYIIPGEKTVDAVQLDGPDVITFIFSQTEFFTVTAYQNLSITQLKIDYNPFAKGFRDDASNSRAFKPNSALSTEKLESEVKSSKEGTALNNLKSLLAKINASEKATTNGDLKTIHCDGFSRAEPESSSSSMKRPWPGGLSELIKGADVKVNRISPEKSHDDRCQQVNVGSLASKEDNMDVASEDCTPENISIPDVTKQETVLFPNITDSSTRITDVYSATDMQCQLNNTSSTTLNEEVATILSEPATLPVDQLSSEETSQSLVRPIECGGEVKKKRAEPVPLPLLALFLQQLKSKTKPTRPKPKSEACSSPSQSDKSCHDASVTENLSSSTASSSPPLNTQLNIQPAVSPASQTITSSILTCTVARIEHETVSTSHSVTDGVTALTANVVHDAVKLSTPINVFATTSAFAHEVKPNTNLLDITPNFNTVSDTLDDASSICVPSCDSNDFLATTPDASNNKASTDTTDKSTTGSACDSCTFPCPELVSEAVPRSQTPGLETPPSPPCAPSSPHVSAPSSPDPFPPSMFSHRPIPPRKTLDPFPPCLSLDRQRSLLKPTDILPQNCFTRLGDPGQTVLEVTSEVNYPPDSAVLSPNPRIQKDPKHSQKASKSTKYKVKQKKGGKSKLSEDTELIGPVPVPMQPNLEDVEGQLFVSFVSKKALEIHLGDETNEDRLKKITENTEGEVNDEQKNIDALEKVLLHDLKNMKYRQVIHPVLQAVGLKLNLLDVMLSIDLQYLGVCLPIPPPVPSPKEFLGTSSQVHFISRTGKTTDITKIKGWREKFSTTSTSSTVPGVTTSVDTGQKNLSAFCSDMLDEYLENEGKLIDARAASFSQAVVTPVAYQLPTKSTSYVRTLDSVLKKQATPLATSHSNPSAKTRKTALTSKSKAAVSSLKRKNSIKSNVKDPASSMDNKSEGSTSNKSTKSKTSKLISSTLSAAPGSSQSKKSPKIKTRKGSKISQHSLQTSQKPVSVAPEGQKTPSIPGSSPPLGRSSGLPKTLVKLRDVEDGAVWEGKNRTYITMERAAIALSCLVTAEGTIGGSSSTVIKRRAPPCLNDFCRLGCVCASLIQEKRQHHCGKPQCMLRCDCLRRKVVLLKNKDTDKCNPLSRAEENGTKVKKKKSRISYILSGPEAAPEPALHVKTLWVRKNDLNSEQLYVPDSAWPLYSQATSQAPQKDLEDFLHLSPKQAAVNSEGLSKNQESLDCARVRPFCWRAWSPVRQSYEEEGHQEFSSPDSLQDMEEGELRPPTQPGPTKRLEIVPKCTWETEGIRNVVLRTVCERMAQDRLKHPFWIGKYQIQPLSKTAKETDEGSITMYKVVVSKPHVEDSEEKKREERKKQLEAQLIETIGKSEVKGLPLLSQVTPAGLLKAEKKPSGTMGQIMVNGKLYPQAKLELGQMGALHPANRLAAYITGRVCVANNQDAKVVSQTSHTTAVTSTNVATTVTSTPSTFTLDKPPAVARHPVETEFEISCGNPQQQQTASIGTLPKQSAVKSLTFPSSSVSTGSTDLSVSPNMPSKTNTASLASPASITTDHSFQAVMAVPGPAAPGKAFMLRTTGSNVALSGNAIKLMRPLTSTRLAVPGQGVVMLKPTDPSGQVIHLVPLRQFRALNPNVPLHPQESTLIRLPTPNPVSLSKSQTSNAALFCATQDQNKTAVHSTITNTVMTTSSSPVVTKTFTSVSASKTLLLCKKPSAVKLIPGFLKDTTTKTFRIQPQRVFEQVKIVTDPKTSSSALSTLSSSMSHSTNQGLQLTVQSCLSPKKQDPEKSDEVTHNGSTPTKEVCGEGSQPVKMSPTNVIFADHSYTFEMKTSTPSKRPADGSKRGSGSAKGSTYHMLLDEVLDLGLPEETVDCGTTGTVLDSESGDETSAGSHLVEEVVSDSTDLTEDSDLYNDTDFSQSSDDEDQCVVTDFAKNKEQQDSVAAEVQVLIGKEDDELVDIETFEEGAEKGSAPPEQMQRGSSFQKQSDEEGENGNLFKLRKRKDEKKRRITLRNCFYNLRQTLNIEDLKIPRITVLTQALEEIASLSEQRDHLVKARDKLRRKRAYYIEMTSQLSGKDKASVSQKLNEIIAKQKSQEVKDEANDTRFKHKEIALAHSQQNIGTKQKRVGANDEHHSNSKEEHLEFQDQRTENISTNQKISAAKPSQPASPPNSCPISQLRKRPTPDSVSHEKTRPNILICNKPQTLANDQVLDSQVSPVVDAVVPCNQIITISNPLQPIDITSLGERQSTTPGVAAVSISIPSISYPICGENPLPILQPHVLKLASSPVNKPGDCVSLPEVSSVFSLVQSERLLITPQAVLQTQAACNSLAEKTHQTPPSDKAVLEVEKRLDKQLPEVAPKDPEQDSTVYIEDPKKQKEEKTNTPQSEEDDHLLSLLDELVFLSQTSEPQGEAPSLREGEAVITDLLTNNEADMDRDDERSLSPLFLKLDEEDITSPTSKDVAIDGSPPKVDDLVKVIFGSESPPNSLESEIISAARDDSTHVSMCHDKHDAPTPPPLLQMKTGGCTTADSLKEQANLSWRPMPKLAPLGLKTQETGQYKLNSPHAPKSGSKAS